MLRLRRDSGRRQVGAIRLGRLGVGLGGELSVHPRQWSADIADEEPPRFGWLCTLVSGYPDPIDIRCHVHLRSGDLRPRIVLEPTDYPMAVDQRTGITFDRIKQIAAAILRH
jgi:hypothetical protein